MVCPPVREENSRALASELSPVQADRPNSLKLVISLHVHAFISFSEGIISRAGGQIKLAKARKFSSRTGGQTVVKLLLNMV